MQPLHLIPLLRATWSTMQPLRLIPLLRVTWSTMQPLVIMESTKQLLHIPFSTE